MKTITASFDTLDSANTARRVLNQAGFDSVSVRSQRGDEAAGDTIRSDEHGNVAEAGVTANGTTRVELPSTLPIFPMPGDPLENETIALLTLRTEARVEEALDIIDQNYGAVETMSKDAPA